MEEKVETHKIRYGVGLFTHVLSGDMYSPQAALWELIKNGWDAGIRKLRKPRQKPFPITVDLLSFKEHPLSPGQPALVVLDNGEGLTDPSFERFLTVGAVEEQTKSFGLLDQKRIGRIAALKLLKYRSKGYWLLSATSAKGPVRVVHATPSAFAEGKIQSRWVERDDTILYGLCPEGTFTAIVLPGVTDYFEDLEQVAEDLKWFIPRRKAENGFTLRINDTAVEPPPLAEELVVEAAGMAGYFRRDDRKKPQGIRLCDATTNTVMAEAIDMSRHVPYPMGRPEVTGDLFIPELSEHQRTDRTGLSSDFLNSDKWRRIALALFQYFRPRLVELLGDDAVSGSMGKVIRNIVMGMNEVWGTPPEEICPPPGIDPSSDESVFLDDPAGDEPEGKEKKKHNYPKERKPATQKKPRKFMYKNHVYFLSAGSLVSNVPAEVRKGNVVHLNQDDPLFSRFKNAPAALQLYVIEAVISAIEQADKEKHGFDIDVCAQAVQTSLVFYYESLAKKAS